MAYISALQLEVNLIHREDHILLKIIVLLQIESASSCTRWTLLTVSGTGDGFRTVFDFRAVIFFAKKFDSFDLYLYSKINRSSESRSLLKLCFRFFRLLRRVSMRLTRITNGLHTSMLLA